MQHPRRPAPGSLAWLGVLALLAGSPPACQVRARDAGPRAYVRQAALAAFARHARHVHAKRYLTVIDYDLPFTSERLWVLGATRDHSVVLGARVSHAWKSGVLFATRFSNRPGSNLSSAGSYVTARAPFTGSYGHSLRVKGLERGVNDNALKRSIIFHPDMGL
jgi:hypothetical protein